MIPMNETNFFFIRHGQTDWNQERRIQGQIDIALNSQGLDQAERLCHFISQTDDELNLITQCSAIYSSPLGRAMQTALPLATFLNKPITPLDALQERHFGSIQGTTYPDLEANAPLESQKITQRDPHFRPPAGESLLDLRTRVRACLSFLLKEHGGQTVVCFTHGGVLDIIYREATGTAIETKRAWDIPNAGVNHLIHRPEETPHWCVRTWGFTKHLDDQDNFSAAQQIPTREF